MKPLNFLLIALFALAVGCSKTETLSSGGTVDGDDPAVGQKGDGATDTGEPGIPSNDPLVPKADTGTTGGTKTNELPGGPKTDVKTPPVIGEAASNPAVTSKSLVGKYSGKLLDETITMMMSVAPADQRAKVESELRGAVITLDVTPDGKYSLLTSSSGRSENQKGTWSYDEKTGTVTLSAPEITPEQRARLKNQGVTDEQIEAQKKQSMLCDVSKDGKTLKFAQTQMGMTFGIVFTRK